MTSVAACAFLAQAVVILIDEFYFHRKRELPRWELVGHPIDTFCLLSYFLALLMLSPEHGSLRAVAAVLGAVSCLVITKDEWVHKRLSGGTENWLHSLLFVIHPVVVGASFLVWWFGGPLFQRFLLIAISTVGLHLIYQLVEAVRRWPTLQE